MNLEPGQEAVVLFSTIQEGALVGTGTVTAVVIRNNIVTSVAVVVASVTTGHYTVTFTVPATWVEYDQVFVQFDFEWSPGRIIGCTKPVGVVTESPLDVEFIRELLTADQVRVGNSIFYYAAGTGQTVLLHQQDQSGDPCEGDTSLISP